MVNGQGILLSDPLDPKPSTFSPFKEVSYNQREELKDNGLLKPVDNNTIEIINGTYIENVSEDAKAKSLYVNFKANFGFFGANAAYSKVQEEKLNSRTVQFIYELKKSGSTISDGSKKWNTSIDPIESNADLPSRTKDFMSAFGSHYIGSVQYGFKIEILATYFSSESTSQESFNIAMRAWLLKASFSGDWKSLLKSSSKRILCRITSGGLVPNTSAILTSFDDVNTFLEGIKSGAIKINNGPIGYTLHNYSGTLGSFPKCKEIFSSTDSLNPSNFPTGVIIPWFPSPEYIINSIVTPPDGWAICDGTKGTPDLRNQFLIGTDKDFGQTGGTYKHSHSTAATELVATKLWHNVQHDQGIPLAQIGHTHKISEENHLPPFTRVIYIMKK